MGIDPGLKAQCALPRGAQYTLIRSDERKCIEWQRRMARAQETSKNSKKAKAAARRGPFRIAPRRKATVDNIAVDIVKQSSDVACEDLQVCNLTRKGVARKRSQNHTFGLIKQQLTYKTT